MESSSTSKNTMLLQVSNFFTAKQICHLEGRLTYKVLSQACSYSRHVCHQLSAWRDEVPTPCLLSFAPAGTQQSAKFTPASMNPDIHSDLLWSIGAFVWDPMISVSPSGLPQLTAAMLWHYIMGCKGYINCTSLQL